MRVSKAARERSRVEPSFGECRQSGARGTRQGQVVRPQLDPWGYKDCDRVPQGLRCGMVTSGETRRSGPAATDFINY